MHDTEIDSFIELCLASRLPFRCCNAFFHYPSHKRKSQIAWYERLFTCHFQKLGQLQISS